jgi:phosphoribosyl 1,2-cyclic phosphate phosphodiesterase
MALELLILGSGTSAGVPMIGCACTVCTSTDPRDQRTRPSALVRYSDPADPSLRRQILIDTAPDLRVQSLRNRVNRLDSVCFTHAHFDHIFGLDDLRRFNAVMHQPIDIYAEPATMKIIQEKFAYIFDRSTNLNNTFIASLVPYELTAGTAIELFGARWTPVRLMHGKLPIVGFRVDFAGHSLAYCTDVSSFPDESLLMLRDLDVLVIDGLRHTPHPTHQTIERALTVIEMLKPRRAYLTHIAHDIMHSELEPKLPEHVYLATDGLTISCGDGTMLHG